MSNARSEAEARINELLAPFARIISERYGSGPIPKDLWWFVGEERYRKLRALCDFADHVDDSPRVELRVEVFGIPVDPSTWAEEETIVLADRSYLATKQFMTRFTYLRVGTSPEAIQGTWRTRPGLF